MTYLNIGFWLAIASIPSFATNKHLIHRCLCNVQEKFR